MSNLDTKKVAILATHGYEKSELESPMHALRNKGAEVHVVSPESGEIRGWADGEWSGTVKVDKTIDQVKASDYHSLVLPGGVINPDNLRRNEQSVNFVRDFFKDHKPVAAICHGPQMLVEADVIKGRKMTSFPSVRKDMENAGAKWVDESVVVDNGLVTSRSPADLQDFNSKLIEEVYEGKHELQTA